jgi:cytosine/adenosine deaminase-related metal-dependent hydrolase
MSRHLLYCSHVYIGHNKILENAVVVVDPVSGMVEEVRMKRASESARTLIDLGDCMIMPGLVNAHCHLEYSGFHKRLSPEGSFAKWLMQIAELKSHTPRSELVSAARAQLAAIFSSGTTTLFDNCSLDLFDSYVDALTPRHILLYEAIELLPEKARHAFSHLIDRVARGNHYAGLGPHAPYSVSPELLILCCEYASLFNRPLSIHVSETWEEVQFFLEGTGPLFDMRFHSLPDYWQCPKVSPIKYLDTNGVLKHKPLLVHAGCLCEGDMAIIRKNCCTVVFCPGTHRYFERGDYPLLDFLRAGIPVGIGTDSLASNDTLRIVDQLETTMQTIPGLDVATLINLGSWVPNGTFSRWREGGVTPGKVADLSIWKWPYKNLMDWILDKERCCQCSYIDGQLYHA